MKNARTADGYPINIGDTLWSAQITSWKEPQMARIVEWRESGPGVASIFLPSHQMSSD